MWNGLARKADDRNIVHRRWWQKKLAKAVPRDTVHKHVYRATVWHMTTSKIRDVAGEEYSQKGDFDEYDLEKDEKDSTWRCL